jgi:hypothetical protein
MERASAEAKEYIWISRYLRMLGFCENGTIDNVFQSCSSWLEMIESTFEGRRIWEFLLISPLFSVNLSEVNVEGW